MQIYMLTLEIIEHIPGRGDLPPFTDSQLAGAVVIAESAAHATELIVKFLDEDWEEASVERIGIADPGSSKPCIVAVDLT